MSDIINVNVDTAHEPIAVDVTVTDSPIAVDVSEVRPSGGHTDAEVRDGILYIEDIDGVEFIIGG